MNAYIKHFQNHQEYNTVDPVCKVCVRLCVCVRACIPIWKYKTKRFVITAGDTLRHSHGGEDSHAEKQSARFISIKKNSCFDVEVLVHWTIQTEAEWQEPPQLI